MDVMASSIQALYQRYRHWILYSYAFITVSFAAGAVYGWPALRRKLRAEGSTLSEEQFGAVFTAGAWSAQGVRFVTGLLRDRFGTRRIAVVALLCSTAGFCGMAWSDKNNPITLGIFMFIIGTGSGLILCVQPVAGLFPGYAGSIMSSLAGAFQVSGLVFLVLSEIGTRQATFTGFCFVLFGLALLAFWLLPKGKTFSMEVVDANKHNEKNPMETVEESETKEGETNLYDIQSNTAKHKPKTLVHGSYENKNDALSEINVTIHDDQSGIESEMLEDNGNNDPEECRISSVNTSEELSEEIQPPTPLQQIFSLECLLFYIWFALSVTPLQYYVGSIGFQLEERGDADGLYTTLYTAFYSSAAVFSPVGGWIADTWGLGLAEAFASLLCAASFFCLASEGLSLNGQVVGFILYGIGRMFVFGLFFTHVGKRFGYHNFGTLAGLGLLLSALLSLIQYPMIAAAADEYAQEMNLLSGATFVIMIPYFGWLTRKEYQERRQVLRSD